MLALSIVGRRRKKQVFVWIAGIGLFILVPTLTVGKFALSDMASKVGRDKQMLVKTVTDFYNGAKLSLGSDIRSEMTKATKEKGKFLAVGVPDTVPNVNDLLARGAELSFNLPVQFEKGYKTFTFRVRNAPASAEILSAMTSEGILPTDNFRKLLREKI